MKLNGKYALVTGSAQRIGRGIAFKLAEEGVNIIVHYSTSADKSDETIQVLSDLGVETLKIQADLGDYNQIIEMFTNIEENIGKLDLLVNNASTFKAGSLLNTDIETWNTTMSVNLTAPLVCMQQAHRIMMNNVIESKLIVNISDIIGKQYWNKFTAHSVSKSALIHLTKLAAKEFSPSIRVNAIVPGLILPPKNMSNTSKRWIEMEQNTPLKSSGNVSDIGRAVVYLAENDYITGETITIDGGASLL
ncbi:MAG: SDR family oxidoreductase, partial [Candidatus Heimdallarchaeota archaeon]|nr:SDR family oxidoreductase [Candidatus Heimdallarchaeota archaeon]